MKIYIYNLVVKSVAGATLVTSFLLISFLLMEPMVTRGATDSDVFIVTQSVTAEISFSTTANDVTMSPAIAGLTGGTATGQTQVVVTTNNATGYYMTLQFSTSTAMQGNANGGEISNYTPASGIVPDYAFSVAPNTGEFAYSVVASSSADVDQTFLDNGSDTCGIGSTNGANTCWAAPSTTLGTAVAETVITTSAASPASGSTSTIKFQVQINSNPSPAIPADTYTATATLTAITN